MNKVIETRNRFTQVQTVFVFLSVTLILSCRNESPGQQGSEAAGVEMRQKVKNEGTQFSVEGLSTFGEDSYKSKYRPVFLKNKTSPYEIGWNFSTSNEPSSLTPECCRATGHAPVFASYWKSWTGGIVDKDVKENVFVGCHLNLGNSANSMLESGGSVLSSIRQPIADNLSQACR